MKASHRKAYRSEINFPERLDCNGGSGGVVGWQSGSSVAGRVRRLPILQSEWFACTSASEMGLFAKFGL